MLRADELPLFPLSAVLLPGCAMELRIFERRYLDMIGECGRVGRGFAICLILEGTEAGAPAVPASIGCEAQIEDFWTLPDGLLGIRVRGGARVRVTEVRVRDNGLLIGRVQRLAEAALLPLPPEFGLLATLLRRMADRASGALGSTPAARFDDAEWVSWTLACELPLSASERQLLLQEDAVQARLETLLHWLPRFAEP